jgi:hypothetical protein
LALALALGPALTASSAVAIERETARETEPEAAAPTARAVPPWLAQLRNREGRVSWRAITIGMEMRAVASLLRVHLRTDRVMEVGCGGDALEIVVDGVKVLMGFEGDARDAKLHTLFVFVDPPIDSNEAVAALKHQLPELARSATIIPRLHDSDDPRPAYRIGDPEIAVMVDPRGIWLSHPTCVE